MSPSEGDGYEEFFVAASPDTAAEAPEFEGANVCRVAALSTMLGNDRTAAQMLEAELGELGFSPQLRSGDWDWGTRDPAGLFAGLPPFDGAPEERRVGHWEMVGETAEPDGAVAFLVDVLGSRLERESVAAAAALWLTTRSWDGWWAWRASGRWPFWPEIALLWEEVAPPSDPRWPRPGWWFPQSAPDPAASEPLEEGAALAWDPDRWRYVYERIRSLADGSPESDALLVQLLSGWRLGEARVSPDPVTRSLALAPFLSDEDQGGGEPASPATSAPEAPAVSTMVHGTWGWVGDWWRPPGGFHGFVRGTHRPNLHSGGARFSWSGAYRASHRAQAAVDLCDWAADVAPQGLQSVFAHSYGGEVASRAVVRGARVEELVLLSEDVWQAEDVARRGRI